MSVSKMPDGRWKMTCRYTTFDGTRKQKKKEGFQTKREAQQFEREFLQKMTGSLSMSMSSLFDLYIEDAKARVKPATLFSIQTCIESRLRPAFGTMQVDKVTPLNIRQWYNALKTEESDRTGRQLESGTVTVICTRLSAIFNFACKFYGLPKNPCHGAIDYPKEKKKEMRFLSLEQFELFLAQEQSHIHRIAFETLFWSGMRVGELLALTPADIQGNQISISKTYLRMNKSDIIGTPKTPTSNRTISLPDHLAESVAEIADKTTGRVFEAATLPTLRSHCRTNCIKAGVPVIRVHDLRHSHASFLIDKGISPLLIAERLGHENVNITLRVYSHLYQSKREELTDILNNRYDSATL